MLGLTDDFDFKQPTLIAAHSTEGMPLISKERLDEIIREAVKAIRTEAAEVMKKE